MKTCTQDNDIKTALLIEIKTYFFNNFYTYKQFYFKQLTAALRNVPK